MDHIKRLLAYLNEYSKQKKNSELIELIVKGEVGKAIRMNSTSIKVDEINLAYKYNNQGSLYEIINEKDSALIFYEKAIKLNEDFPKYKIDLSILLIHHGQYRKAISYIDKLEKQIMRYKHAALDHYLLPAVDWLGDAYEQLGEHEKAV